MCLSVEVEWLEADGICPNSAARNGSSLWGAPPKLTPKASGPVPASITLPMANLFVLRRVQAGEFGGIADVLLHLRILLNQDFKDALITANLGMLAFGEEIIELGLLFLTVTINTTIALLEGEQ